MGRTHTVKNHPQIHRINTMIADGIPYAEIAREVALPVSTLARYASLKKSELSKRVDDEPGAVTVLTRLVEAADHARLVRRQAELNGSPVAQSRAIKGEVDVISKLLTELGIDDVRIVEFLDEAQALAIGIRLFARTYPESAADLLRVLSQTPETRQLAEALKAQVRTRNDR